MTSFLKAHSLSLIQSLAHGFFGKAFDLKKDDDLKRAASLKRIGDELMVSSDKIVTLEQIHSKEVVVVKNPHVSERPKGDALITCTKGLMLGIFSADCVPILLATPEGSMVAAIHAGFRGAFLGIVDTTIQEMRRRGAHTIIAALGPCIWQKSYEVSEDFYKNFGPSPYFISGKRTGHWQFDLPGYVISCLKKNGITSIEQLPVDTYSNHNFNSYRRTTHNAGEILLSNFSAIGLTSSVSK